MIRKYAPHVGLSVLFSLLGTGFGIMASPNYLRVHVDQLGKQSLAPANGDVIEWDALDDSSMQYQVAINFPGPSNPCSVPQLLSKGICVVQYPAQNRTYQFNCPVCSDPNLGPKSSTGGIFTGWFSGLGIVRDLKLSSLRNSTDLAPRHAAEGQVPAGAGSRGVYAQVSCVEGSMTEIESGGAKNLIEASPGSKIVFGGDPGFKITDNTNVCTLSSSGNSCTVLSTLATGRQYTFTATANNCNANKAEVVDVNP